MIIHLDIPVPDTAVMDWDCLPDDLADMMATTFHDVIVDAIITARAHVTMDGLPVAEKPTPNKPPF